MYIPIATKTSIARAWAAAASAIAEVQEGYNVVIDINDPGAFDWQDNNAIQLVDDFLRTHDQNPISTVANTIFPQALYEEFDSPAFYSEYLKVFSRLTKSKKWGRYFERMIQHRTLEGQSYNPLADLIEKLKAQCESGNRFKATHELAIYDPLLDRRYRRGGQCLSFISLKLHPDAGLLLTAIYRNHHYITKCLGNLIGLGRLQAFIAPGAGVKVGSLTCISTHAELDTGKGWGVTEARKLINEVSAILTSSTSSTSSRALPVAASR